MSHKIQFALHYLAFMFVQAFHVLNALQEHLHLTEPEECSDLYSKEEICSFDQVVHDRLVDWSVSRKDAVAALDILGFSQRVEDLHLSFQN